MIRWHWYDHVPAIPLAALVLLSLLLVRANWHWQAWWILVPVLAIVVAWRMIARLLFMPASTAETFGVFAVSLAVAWSVVWLLGEWLSRQRVFAALSMALAAMLAVGGVSHVAHFGAAVSRDSTLWAVLFAICSLALLGGTALSSYCCRKVYSTRRFLLWLLMGTVLVAVVAMPVFAVILAALETDSPLAFLSLLVMALIMLSIAGGVVGIAIYGLQLPFVLLAVRCPLYRGRFHRALRLPGGRTLASPAEAASTAISFEGPQVSGVWLESQAVTGSERHG